MNEEEKMSMEEKSAGVFVIVSVCVSLFTCLLASASVCSVFEDCLEQETCIDLRDGWCSFSNLVAPIGYRLFNTSEPSSALQALERGVCAWGERQNVIDGELVCLRERRYPSALNTEIMELGASSFHKRYCGKWLNSDRPLRVRYWSFFDAEIVARDVNDAISSKHNIHDAVTDVGKFRSACVRMVASNSDGPSAQLAYEHLKKLLPLPSSREELVMTAGILSAHYCDAPAMIGVTYLASKDGTLSVNVSDGHTFEGLQLWPRLYAAGESRDVGLEAKEFAEVALASKAAIVYKEDVDRYVLGSLRGTVLEGLHYSSTEYTAELEHLAKFLSAADSEGIKAAHSYLLGLAAACSYAVRSVTTGSGGEVGFVSKSFVSSSEGVDLYQEMETGRTAALGRMPSQSVGDRLEVVSPERMLEATSVGWSLLYRDKMSSTFGTAKDNAESICEQAVSTIFPDEIDASVFEYLVPMHLYRRLEAMTSVIREAVRVTVLGPIIAPLFADASDLSSRVAASVVTVAGSPRKSWAGRNADAVKAGFDSRDGCLVMVMKQARAVFNERVGLALSGVGVVEHPPVMSSLSRNAYMFYHSGVAVLLPGIMVPPFAEKDYDDLSLYSRIGYVIAHELAHVTAAVVWNELTIVKFLSDLGYAPSEYIEAIADVIAVSALLNAGVVDNTTMCQSVSQIWCAREASALLSPMVDSRSSGSHPPPNARGDRLCVFIQKHYSSSHKKE